MDCLTSMSMDWMTSTRKDYSKSLPTDWTKKTPTDCLTPIQMESETENLTPKPTAKLMETS